LVLRQWRWWLARLLIRQVGRIQRRRLLVRQVAAAVRRIGTLVSALVGCRINALTAAVRRAPFNRSGLLLRIILALLLRLRLLADA
jgi:hypothetical protein